jgi:hypothetical protein
MERADRLADRWDEDERAPPRIIGGYTAYRPKEEPYVSITSILKQYYDEEKAALYCYDTYSSPTKKKTCEYYYDDQESQVSSSSNLGETSEQHESEDESSASSSPTPEPEEDPLVKIVEDSVYKKFSYV